MLVCKFVYRQVNLELMCELHKVRTLQKFKCDELIIIDLVALIVLIWNKLHMIRYEGID